MEAIAAIVCFNDMGKKGVTGWYWGRERRGRRASTLMEMGTHVVRQELLRVLVVRGASAPLSGL